LRLFEIKVELRICITLLLRKDVLFWNR